MRSAILFVAGCLTLLFAWEWLASSVSARADPLVCTGAHYRLLCHVRLDSVAQDALDIAEETWPVAMELYGDATPAPEPPLDVHLYRDPAEYETAEEELTRGRFKRNLAFAHWDTKTAHVAVQPQLPTSVLRELGLNFQTLRLLVHETSHLARFWAMPNYRSHPGWLADGNASWIETEVLRRRGTFAAPEEDPSFSTDVVRAQRLAERGALPTVDAILHDRTTGLDFYEVYAVRWLLFRFLMQEHAPALRGTIAAMRRFGGGGDFVGRVAKALRKQLGAESFEALDADFHGWLTSLEPQWEEIYPSLETHGAAWVQTAFDEVNAIAWRTGSTGNDPFELTGSVEILPDGKNQLNVLLGRDDDGFVSVALSPEHVDVFEYCSADESWTELGEARAPSLLLHERVPFRVRCIPGRGLSVDIGGEQVLEVELERPLSGPWGLGAQAGSTGVWHGLTFTSMP